LGLGVTAEAIFRIYWLFQTVLLGMGFSELWNKNVDDGKDPDVI
jgi:hypothetical protein